MKKVLSLVLSLVMLLSLVVPVSAEDTIFEGNGTLKQDRRLYHRGGQDDPLWRGRADRQVPHLCGERGQRAHPGVPVYAGAVGKPDAGHGAGGEFIVQLRLHEHGHAYQEHDQCGRHV